MQRSKPRLLACAIVLSLAPIAALAQAPAATPPAAPMAGLPDFTGIVQKNAPAVVHVEAKYGGVGKSARGRRGMQGMPAMPGAPDGGDDDQDDILRRFFGMPMMPSPEQRKAMSLGSGFILSKDGYILTNNHVVQDADEVSVRLQDHRTLTAKVVGSDPQYDIALLKVNASGNLPTVSIGDSKTLKPGQWVLAIGSPFGFDYTVTQGIVSAVGRNLGEQEQRYTSFIQTDVPINRGNSGGPLFNLAGQVVGVNSQIYSSSGGYQGVAFSIPIDLAMNAVEQIKGKGFVTRGQLGVMVGPLTDDVVKGMSLPSSNGAIVSQVQPGSAADKAGFQAGDVILKYNGQSIQNSVDLPPLVGLSKPGTRVPVEIMRGGKHQTIQALVGTAPRDQGAVDSMMGASPDKAASADGASALGLTVQPIDADTRQQAGLKSGEGVMIGEVTGPAAASAGLQQGDVILMVGQQKVGSVAAFRAATAGVKPGGTVLMLVRRGGQSQFIGLTVPSDK